MKRIGTGACQLEFPPSSKIHDVLHVSLLQLHKGMQVDKVPELPPVADGHVVPIPAKIIHAHLNRGT